MSGSNIFDPPTPEELKQAESAAMFAPPTSAELGLKDEGSGAAMTALEQYGNTATLGNLPHIQAMFEKLMPKAGADVDEQLRAQGFTIDQPERFVDSRDANIKRMARDAALNPKSALLGKGLGVVGSGLITSKLMPVVQGAGLLGRFAQAGKSGAILGGLSNPGDVEGEVSPFQLGDRLKNAGIGLATGLGTQGLVEGGSYLAKGAADYLKNLSKQKAYRALGRQTPKAMQKAQASGQDLATGEMLLEEGAIPILGTPGRIAKRVDKLKEAAGEEVGNLVGSAGNAKLVDAEKLAIEILDSPELALMRTTPGMESTVAAIEKQVETLAKNKTMTLKEAQTLRQQIDKSINFNKAAPDMRGAQEGLYTQRTKLRDEMSDALDKLNPSASKGELIKANRKYGQLADAEDVLAGEVARNANNRSISLTDYLSMIGGAAKGGPTLAMAAGAANKAARAVGNAVQARGAQTLSGLSAKNAARLAALGSQPTALQGPVAAITQGVLGRNALAPNPESEILNNPDLLKMLTDDPSLIDKIFVDEKTRKALKSKLNRKPSNKNERRIKALEE